MDHHDLMDDLIDSYVQIIHSVIAIDKMCVRVAQPSSECLDTMPADNRFSHFNHKLFAELNPDPMLIRELWT